MTANIPSNLYGPARVGGDCLSYCTKCKMELAHVIVSMVDLTPVQVICKTCKGQHKFRKAPGEKVPSARSKSGKAATKSKTRVADLWQEKISQKHSDGAVSYRTDQTFAAGDVLKHPNFGVGIVEEVRYGGKILVLFQDTQRTLIHGLQK